MLHSRAAVRLNVQRVGVHLANLTVYLTLRVTYCGWSEFGAIAVGETVFVAVRLANADSLTFVPTATKTIYNKKDSSVRIKNHTKRIIQQVVA